MLSANGLANARTKKFVSQNVEGAFNDYTRKMANTLTDAGHYAETGYEGGKKPKLIMCGGAFSPHNYHMEGLYIYDGNRKVENPTEYKMAKAEIEQEAKNKQIADRQKKEADKAIYDYYQSKNKIGK
jgi:hypothetical protein